MCRTNKHPHKTYRNRCARQQVNGTHTGAFYYVRCFWPSLLTFGLVLWLTLAPDPAPDMEMPSFLGEYADKIVHFVMMGGLTGAWIFDLKRRRPGAPRHLGSGVYASLVVAMAVFCMLDEWAQGAMGLGRAADIWDYAADMAGVGTALLVAPPVCDRLIRRMISVKRPKQPAE